MTGVQVIAVSHRKHLPQLADKVFRVGKGEQIVNKSQKLTQVLPEDVEAIFKEIQERDQRN